MPGLPAPAPAAARAALGTAGTIKVCMVCDNNVWRAATQGEMGNCKTQDIEYLGQPCFEVAALEAPRHGRTCEPWVYLYCDHSNGCNGWRFPRNCWELQQSYCLPISHCGRQCWFEHGHTPQPGPK